MFIYANYGLSQSVIRGTVAPDTHVLDRESLEPTMDIIGFKSMQVVVRADRIAETGVPGEMQRRFRLLPNQVRTVAKLATSVEARLQKRFDVEWAYENGSLYLLEIREPGEYALTR